MGGPVVIAGLITALSRYERIALVYLRGCDEASLDKRVREACDIAVEVPRFGVGNGEKGYHVALHTGVCALRDTPRWVAEWDVPEFRRVLQTLVPTFEPDIIQAEFHLMGQYLSAIQGSTAPKLLTQHEPGWTAMADKRRSGLMAGRIMPLLQERAWSRYERRLLRELDAVVTFTERDRDAMIRLDGSIRTEIIAPGTQIPIVPLDARGYGPPALLFFGNYLHTPNIDAALRLARDIFPLVSEEAPDLTLWLPGDQPPEELRRLASARIAVPGRVDEVAPYLDAAAVVVVPVRIGGGMRVKVIETLGAGKALVASDRAVAGLSVVDGEHFLRAESDDEFAAAVRWLLEHPDERAAMGARARSWAMANLSWDRAATEYVALHEDLLTGRSEERKEHCPYGRASRD